MMTSGKPVFEFSVREAKPDEFASVALFWYAMGQEIGWRAEDLVENWLERKLAYYARRSRAGELRSFVAQVGGEVVGSASGFVIDGYPRDFFRRNDRGYIIGVYVRPEFRRRGIARALTVAATEWLLAIGCRVVRLHASEAGRHVYPALGFVPSNEMELRANDRFAAGYRVRELSEDPAAEP
jgi:ribosomal protein S18 acetylase RimI-like enzyme